MKCISPLTFKRDGHLMTVPCGKCNFCLQKRQKEWSFRLNKELAGAMSAFFVTLTYDDSNVPVGENGVLSLCKRDFQLFMKRLRKANEKEGNKSIDKEKVQPRGDIASSVRYFAVGEYGTKTNRPHYHVILFNVWKSVAEDISSIWKKGNVHIGNVNEASISYTLKYMIDKSNEDPEGVEKSFSVMSRRPGLGMNYLSKDVYLSHVKNMDDIVVLGGRKQSMPRYYRDKVFTYSERSKINEEKVRFAEEKESEFVRQYKGSKSPYQVLEENLRDSHDAISLRNEKKRKF